MSLSLTLVLLAAQIQPAVQVSDVVVGQGASVKPGQRVTLHLLAKTSGGRVLADTEKRGLAYTFTLGDPNEMPGWRPGLEGMKVGGTRRLVVPPELGYGAQGEGSIVPPNATLVLVVKLLRVDG